MPPTVARVLFVCVECAIGPKGEHSPLLHRIRIHVFARAVVWHAALILAHGGAQRSKEQTNFNFQPL